MRNIEKCSLSALLKVSLFWLLTRTESPQYCMGSVCLSTQEPKRCGNASERGQGMEWEPAELLNLPQGKQ